MLVASLALLHSVAVPPLNYTCQNNQCVVSNRGLPKVYCDQVCGAPPMPNILQLAESVPELSTLVTALNASDLTGLVATGQFLTVFAPTNDAFSALPPETLKSLLEPQNIKQLQAVLSYHVAESDPVNRTQYLSKNLVNHQRIPTLQGESVEVTLLDEAVFIDRSRVLKADNLASNGVVHIVDKVLVPLLLPPAPTPAPGPPSPPGPSPPTGNHLYFRATRIIPARPQCGQVDAAPRMPPTLFEPQNHQILQEYINATLAFSNKVQREWPELVLGQCNEIGYSRPAPCFGSSEAQWAPAQFMGPICSKHCGCLYPHCKDVPDNPAAATWCSLCGPRYNGPVNVECWITRD